MRVSRLGRRGWSGARRSLRVLLAVGLVVGCTEPYRGAPSLSLLSAGPTRDHYRAVGPVRTSVACRQSVLFLFGGGDPPSHEAVLARMLAESGADVLLDARLTTERVSLLVFSRTCAVVRGQPAVLRESAG